MAPAILGALNQPDFYYPVKRRPTVSAVAAIYVQPIRSAEEKRHQGKEKRHATHGPFCGADEHAVRFLMFSVVHRGMIRRLSMIFSHGACHYRGFLSILAFAMILSARKREKDRICQIFVRLKD